MVALAGTGFLAVGIFATVILSRGVDPRTEGSTGREGLNQNEVAEAQIDSLSETRTLQRGETLGQLFNELGVSGPLGVDVFEAVGTWQDPRRLRVGTQVTVSRIHGEPPSAITVELDPDRIFFANRGPPPAGEWAFRMDSVPVVEDTVLLAGRIRNNLFDAQLFGDVDVLGPGGGFDVGYELSQVYAWQIDFYRDLRPHDAFRVLIAREVRPDGTRRSTRVLAAEFLNEQRLLHAIGFNLPDSLGVEYYDEGGEALRTFFLLAPLDIARVTSTFNLRRFHPVLQRVRPHRGVDYGAARGTPVLATGRGRVTRAGAWGSYGTAIEILHMNNIRTRYAHLSGIASGVRVGAQVEQGATIGYVGSTGLATAPHLHYEFLQDGRQVNPLTVDLPPIEPVSDEHRPAFDAVTARLMPLLRRIPLPRPPLQAVSTTNP